MIVVVNQMLGESVRNPNRSIDSVLKELKNAFAHVLNWSVSDIHVEKINVSVGYKITHFRCPCSFIILWLLFGIIMIDQCFFSSVCMSIGKGYAFTCACTYSLNSCTVGQLRHSWCKIYWDKKLYNYCLYF